MKAAKHQSMHRIEFYSYWYSNDRTTVEETKTSGGKASSSYQTDFNISSFKSIFNKERGNCRIVIIKNLY